MKRMTTLALAAAALALGLAACSSSSDEPAEAAPAVEISTTDDLNSYVADAYNGTAELFDGSLTLAVDSQGSELQDQDMTTRLLQAVGGSPLEYDDVTITTSTGDGPTWGYRYDADTVADIASKSTTDGSLVFTEIWDMADA